MVAVARSDLWLNYPYDVRLLPNGNIAILNGLPALIAELDSAGRLLWLSTWPDSNQYGSPGGIGVDTDGNIFVSEARNVKIHKFGPSGVWLSAFGVAGRDPGELMAPCGIAFDPQGNLAVADNNLNKVQKYDASGAYTGWSCGSSSPPHEGDPDPGKFYGLTAVAIASNGMVYALDSMGCFVNKFDANGTYIGRFGGYGKSDQQFLDPNRMALQSLSLLWIADSDSCMLKKMDTDTGNCLLKIGSPGILEDLAQVACGCHIGLSRELLCG
ncbi:MAG TPA: NHL repeat-containing protein [Armatimonadota bacterium]|nr:NHL repeat-containing protein [Armatimonadota bacterium]